MKSTNKEEKISPKQMEKYEELLRTGPHSSTVIEGIGLAGSISKIYLQDQLMIAIDLGKKPPELTLLKQGKQIISNRKVEIIKTENGEEKIYGGGWLKKGEEAARKLAPRLY